MTMSLPEEYTLAHKSLFVFDRSLLPSFSFQKYDRLLGGLLTTKYSILENSSVSSLLQISPSVVHDSGVKSNFNELLESEVEKLVKTVLDENNTVLLSDLICVAISFLQLFTQSNFTGPATPLDIYQKTVKVAKADQKSFDEYCLKTLSKDGEPAYILTSYPHLLVSALTILSSLSNAKTLESSPLLPYIRWWLTRAYVLQQSLLENNSSSIYESISAIFQDSLLDHILDGAKDSAPNNDESTFIRTAFYLEFARIQLIYNFDNKADHYLKLAQQSSGLTYALTGCKAKSTKYQEKETAQLIFLAKSLKDKEVLEHDDSFDSLPPPIALELNSDLLLEKVKYSKEGAKNNSILDDPESLPAALRKIDPNNQPLLQDIDSALVLMRIEYKKSTSPFNNPLIQKELITTANRLIESPEGTVNWSLYSRSLWERSVQEASSPRTVERGTLQMQSLVDELGQSSHTYIAHDTKNLESLPERLSYIHQIYPLPKWDMDSKLADRYMNIGSFKSALEVYERLEMWHQVALCHASVGNHEEALDVIKGYLERKPDDARAWSILGDLTGDPQYWEKAWEIGKYPGSRRSLGNYYYNPPKSAGISRNLDLAIKYFNESLQVNPLHYETWFIYGCAGLETEQYDIAAEAFTRCVAIDEDDGKSWSNLATALLRLGKKAEAFSALKRALRVATETKNWRIWTNYVTIAIELGDWIQVLRGTNELLKIDSQRSESSLDTQVLNALAQQLIKTDYPKTTDGDDDESMSDNTSQAPRLDFFQQSCITLFTETLPPLITNDPSLWKLVAKVELWRKRPWAALDAYEKGFRIFTHIPQIESDESVWNNAVEFCEELVDAYTNLGPMEGRHGNDSVVCSNWKFKARSAVRLLMGKGKKWWEDTPGWEKLMEIKDSI